MADALISPETGAGMLAVSGVALWYCTMRAKKNFDARDAALSGVLGAFVFGAQMLNFTIPASGSSGHITGAIFLSSILGGWRAFISMACIIAIQALLFADGGLIAYGCNLFNMSFWSCLVCYPLIFRPIAKNMLSNKRIFTASIIACIAASILGAFSVVLETVTSDVVEIPVDKFLSFMMPIHFCIGLIEGIATSALLIFLHRSRPELFNICENEGNKLSIKTALCALLVGIFCLAVLSKLASKNPDGLEWSLEKSGIAADDEPRPAMEYDLFGGALGSCIAFGAISAVVFIVFRNKSYGGR